MPARSPSRPPRATLPLALALLLLAAAPAAAGTLKVPKQYPTIQSAINAASAGDTVLVAAGEYRETVVVPSFKTGLKLIGKGGPVLDADGDAFALHVEADGVLVRGFVLRHASSAAVRVEGPGGGAVAGVRLEHLSARNAGSTSFGAFYVEADEAVLRKLEVLASDGYGLRVLGSDALVQQCRTVATYYHGVLVVGVRARVERCDVRDVFNYYGIEINGDQAVVDRNVVGNTYYSNLAVSGKDAVVTRNTALGGCDDEVIEVAGEAPLVSRNVVPFSSWGYIGLYVHGSQTGGLVERNEVRSTTGVGLYVAGSGHVVRQNVLESCGFPGHPALEVHSTSSTIERNTIIAAPWTGIAVHGPDVLLKANKVTGGAGDGVRIASVPGVVLDGNLIKGNESDGVRNQGSSTVLRRNTVLGNRIDITNTGTITIEPGNKYGTGGADTAPGF